MRAFCRCNNDGTKRTCSYYFNEENNNKAKFIKINYIFLVLQCSYARIVYYCQITMLNLKRIKPKQMLPLHHYFSTCLYKDKNIKLNKLNYDSIPLLDISA